MIKEFVEDCPQVNVAKKLLWLQDESTGRWVLMKGFYEKLPLSSNNPIRWFTGRWVLMKGFYEKLPLSSNNPIENMTNKLESKKSWELVSRARSQLLVLVEANSFYNYR